MIASHKRIASGMLSLALLSLLARNLFAQVADFRTCLMLAVGAVLGILYTVMGRIPEWIVRLSRSRITEDDDPSNISAKIYLPILLAVITITVVGFVIALQLT